MINTEEAQRHRCPTWARTDEIWWTQKPKSRMMMLSALWGQRSWEICDRETRPEGLQEKAHRLYIENTFVLNGQTLTWRTFFFQIRFNLQVRKLSNESIKKKKDQQVSRSGRTNWTADGWMYQFPLKYPQQAKIYGIHWYRLLLALSNFN